jgi:hypothetical protein
MNNFFEKMNTRSLVILILVLGAVGLAVLDPNFRPAYGDLAKISLGGYLGQLLPQGRRDY